MTGACSFFFFVFSFFFQSVTNQKLTLVFPSLPLSIYLSLSLSTSLSRPLSRPLSLDLSTSRPLSTSLSRPLSTSLDLSRDLFNKNALGLVNPNVGSSFDRCDGYGEVELEHACLDEKARVADEKEGEEEEDQGQHLSLR